MSISDKDLGFQRIMETLASLGSATVETGIFEGEDSANGSGELTLAGIGAVHEYGCEEKNIPKRPWLSRSADEKGAAWADRCNAALDKAVANGSNVIDALALQGEHMASDVRKTIDAVTTPEKAESTLKKNPTHDHPLIDFGNMKASVRSRIALKGATRMTPKAK